MPFSVDTPTAHILFYPHKNPDIAQNNMGLNMLPNDTSLQAEQVQLSILKKLGSEGRYRMTVDLSDNIRDITVAGIKHKFPQYSDEMVMKTLIKYFEEKKG